ncbi:hypothetical protein EDB85DRAFT_1542101 [Lactarius pseudohatsudake]|nr:hypothetical protein EDB85DRAFT_1542101 [Lactarius pseudohatsudake]
MTAVLPDETNVARGFSLLLMARAAGYRIAPFIGGVLSRPQDHWADRFSHPFWPNTHVSYRASWLLPSPHIVLRDGDVFGRERSPPANVQFAKADLDVVSQKKSARQAPKQDPERPLPLRALDTRTVIVSTRCSRCST